MKMREINERSDWTFIVPDNVADWDAPSHWERERLASMEQHLRPGMVLYDIGTEHGWLSAVYGTFVGHDNMVLVEPSLMFWPNIRMTWEMNGFDKPLGCYAAFASNTIEHDPQNEVWPDAAYGPECDAMAYRHLKHDYLGPRIPSITIDEMRERVAPPAAITVDVEGAEWLVMDGARLTLALDRPLVWISVHRDMMQDDFGHKPHQLNKLMIDAGYQSHWLAEDHEMHVLWTPNEMGWRW